MPGVRGGERFGMLDEAPAGIASPLREIALGLPAAAIGELEPRVLPALVVSLTLAVWLIDGASTGGRHGALAPTLAYDAAAMGDGSLPGEAFARITAPTTVLSGGASPDWMREAAAAAAAAIPGATSVVLPGQTHDVAADTLASAVREAVTAYADRP